ncbi:MAG: FAD-binding protein [Calditrichaeota bacterium]|nr:FAD-binding protein [Calditrichota bacterium]MCB9366532.1 FAD-binding protein [Calditrichota bacterium]MCB9391210.1 FAD-binding protein [Calditrichota bacterium]
MVNRPTRAQIAELQSLLPADELILPGGLNFDRYGRDETEDLHFAPDVVARPKSVESVQSVVRWASKYVIPVVTRGGGTGLSGGALPSEGGVVLSTERLNRILEIDRQNYFVRCEPGIVTQVLQEEVERVGLFYPVDPASKGSCSIGGNVAEGAGGPRALKYGTTKDYVYGVDVVLANGTLAHFGGKRLKDVTGLNMTQLFVGSEGTLGIIVGITLKLLPLPKFRRTLIATFGSLEDAARAVPEILSQGVIPCALEFMEQACIHAIEARRGERTPFTNAAACLLIEVDGAHDEQLDSEIVEIGNVLDRCGALEISIAESPAQQEKLWAFRRQAGEATKAISPYKEEDTVVPRAKLPELVTGVHEICDRWGIRVICYGHAGDGNIHCNLLREQMDETEWKKRTAGAIPEIFALTVRLGGTISGEHGIGLVQREYLPLALSEAEIAAMRSVKGALDPLGILNPGKILP